MENFLKKLKEFEEVVTGSTNYVEDKLKKIGLDGINKYIPYKNNSDEDSNDIEYKEDSKEYKKKQSFNDEFKDCIEDVTLEKYITEEEEKTLINGFDLREAMIAKEVLDKPLCKRRRRRFRGGR